MKKEGSLDLRDAQSVRRQAIEMEPRDAGTLIRELDQELFWLGTVTNSGGASLGLTLTLKGAGLDEGFFSEMIAYVTKVPSGSPHDEDFVRPDPTDEAYWPFVAEFKKGATANVWRADLPEFSYEGRLALQLPLIVAKVGRYSFELEVKPMSENGTSSAKFTLDIDAQVAKPKLKLIVSEATTYKVGPYELTIPGKYEVSVRQAEELMTGMPFLGRPAVLAQLDAQKNERCRFSIIVVDAVKHKGTADIESLLMNIRAKSKMRDFTTLPVVKAQIGGIAFEYGGFKCSDMKFFGLTAVGRSGDNLIFFTAQRRDDDAGCEFEKILKSFNALSDSNQEQRD